MADTVPGIAGHLPQPTGTPRLTVFTITYNQRDKVLDLMQDLAKQTYPFKLFELVVLDDGGADSTFDAVREEGRGVPYAVTALHRDHEADYMSAKRWNECIAAADSATDVFVQVDDVRLRPDFLQQHIKWHARQEAYLVTGAKFESDYETWNLASCRRAHLASADGAARIVPAWTAAWGASLSYRRSLVQKVTQPPHDCPYDERMVGWGFHEVELAYRMVRAGAKVVYDPAAGVFHQNHTVQSERRRGIERTDAVRDGALKNVDYVCGKHGLTSLPRW